MGIPMTDRALLLDQIGAPPSQVAGDAPLKVGPDPLAAMKPLFDTYLHERQDEPLGDLMSELVQAKFKDGTSPDFDALSHLACFLFGAGQDTTSRLIAMAVLVLAEQPDLQERLRAEPGRKAHAREQANLRERRRSAGVNLRAALASGDPEWIDNARNRAAKVLRRVRGTLDGPIGCKRTSMGYGPTC